MLSERIVELKVFERKRYSSNEFVGKSLAGSLRKKNKSMKVWVDGSIQG